MGIQYTGYPYVVTNDSIITTDSTPTSPKPGSAHYSGETQPIAPQVGDLWTSSLGIKRWDGTTWGMYVSSGTGNTSALKSGTTTFSGSSTTISFSSAFSSTPSVVVTLTNSSSSDTGFFVYNVTTSSFAVGAFNMENQAAKSGTYTISWIAANQALTGATSAGTITGTTSSGGIIPVTFGTTYTAAPAVVASWKTLPSSYEPSFGIQSVTTTGFNIVIYTGEGNATVGAGVAAALYWIANPAT